MILRNMSKKQFKVQLDNYMVSNVCFKYVAKFMSDVTTFAARDFMMSLRCVVGNGHLLFSNHSIGSQLNLTVSSKLPL